MSDDTLPLSVVTPELLRAADAVWLEDPARPAFDHMAKGMAEIAYVPANFAGSGPVRRTLFVRLDSRNPAEVRRALELVAAATGG